ncbi:MAG: hypothetical protein AB7N24_20725 [Dehalococcoidia bacterium]
MNHFALELTTHVERSRLPLRRIALRADLPHQTLFNWTNGSQPRWHPKLADDLRRLAAALELDESATERLLQAAGCLPFNRPIHELEKPVQHTLPKYWFPAGSHPSGYEMGVTEDPDRPGRRIAHVRSRNKSEGFGTLMQIFSAEAYRGQRLRLRAEVKALAVEQWAGIWMRIDGSGNEMLAFDNMQDRPIVGNTDWRQYDVILDVEAAAARIAFGVLLSGSGEVRVTDLELTTVPHDVEPTGVETCPAAPMNLDFAL